MDLPLLCWVLDEADGEHIFAFRTPHSLFIQVEKQHLHDVTAVIVGDSSGHRR
jgi:hypothetical protein